LTVREDPDGNCRKAQQNGNQNAELKKRGLRSGFFFHELELRVAFVETPGRVATIFFVLFWFRGGPGVTDSFSGTR
jgi:hypothetical protein